MQWLVNAEIVYKVFRIKTPGLPISAYDDLSAFKIYLSDVGVLNIPLYMADVADQLIGMALDKE